METLFDTSVDLLLNKIPYYSVVFFCGFLVVRGFIAFIEDLQDRHLMRLRDRRLEYEEKNKLIEAQNKYEELTSYNGFYETLEELPKEERKKKKC